MNLHCVFTSHIDEYAFFKVSLMISINTKMPLFQLWASLATWQVKCHTWRFVRRNSSVWKTRPLVRPLGRGQDCLLSGEKPHAILHWCVCILLHKRFFFAPHQHFSCSVGTEWPWRANIRTYVPASRCQSFYRFTSPSWEVRWLWVSRQEPWSFILFFKLNIVCQWDTTKFVSFLQLSHMLKRRIPEGRASSMRI